MKTCYTESILQPSLIKTRNAENSSGSILSPVEDHDFAMILAPAHHTPAWRKIVLITWIQYCRRKSIGTFLLWISRQKTNKKNPRSTTVPPVSKDIMISASPELIFTKFRGTALLQACKAISTALSTSAEVMEDVYLDILWNRRNMFFFQ